MSVNPVSESEIWLKHVKSIQRKMFVSMYGKKAPTRTRRRRVQKKIAKRGGAKDYASLTARLHANLRPLLNEPRVRSGEPGVTPLSFVPYVGREFGIPRAVLMGEAPK